MFGNVDTWLMWNLTGKHVTDVSNASRTLLFDLRKATWSTEMCDFFGIPLEILPKICSSAEVYGHINSGRPYNQYSNQQKSYMIYGRFKTEKVDGYCQLMKEGL